jgi:hypothetical protein
MSSVRIEHFLCTDQALIKELESKTVYTSHVTTNAPCIQIYVEKTPLSLASVSFSLSYFDLAAHYPLPYWTIFTDLHAIHICFRTSTTPSNHLYTAPVHTAQSVKIPQRDSPSKHDQKSLGESVSTQIDLHSRSCPKAHLELRFI